MGSAKPKRPETPVDWEVHAQELEEAEAAAELATKKKQVAEESATEIDGQTSKARRVHHSNPANQANSGSNQGSISNQQGKANQKSKSASSKRNMQFDGNYSSKKAGQVTSKFKTMQSGAASGANSSRK